MEASNVKAMREALNEIRSRLSYLYERLDGTFDPPALKEVYEIARTALSVPPRNCDRFANANEALEAFAKEKGETLIEFVRWLFAEVKGGAK